MAGCGPREAASLEGAERKQGGEGWVPLFGSPESRRHPGLKDQEVATPSQPAVWALEVLPAWTLSELFLLFIVL